MEVLEVTSHYSCITHGLVAFLISINIVHSEMFFNFTMGYFLHLLFIVCYYSMVTPSPYCIVYILQQISLSCDQLFMMDLELTMINHSKHILWHVLFFMSVSLSDLLDVRNNLFFSYCVCKAGVTERLQPHSLLWLEDKNSDFPWSSICCGILMLPWKVFLCNHGYELLCPLLECSRCMLHLGYKMRRSTFCSLCG